jgi:hypothetical protein
MKVMGSEAFFVEARLGFAIVSLTNVRTSNEHREVGYRSGVRRSAEVGRAANLEGEVSSARPRASLARSE